jgi:N-acetylglucosaminyldiphosphoundecaprenol N-acetyl-beta-D-mannosaminyltransferase
VLGARIDAVSWEQVLAGIACAADEHASRYICLCNVHSVVTGTLDPAFMHIINHADLATPDGAPVAWALRKLGYPAQKRINGPDLMWKTLQQAESLQHTVFFYGSTDATLTTLHTRLLRHFPRLQIGGMHSPPFHPLTPQEDAADVAMINRSKAHVVLVGLGCPKQETWMAAHRGRIKAVMIGVGAAFDYHAGTVRRAPPWCQRHGLEWLYRLCAEPRRLFKRYAITNTLFMIGMARQLLRRHRSS